MRPLTPRQSEILELIKDNLHATGMPPTRAEIAHKLGFRSANSAEEHLKALARKGVIEILPACRVVFASSAMTTISPMACR